MVRTVKVLRVLSVKKDGESGRRSESTGTLSTSSTEPTAERRVVVRTADDNRVLIKNQTQLQTSLPSSAGQYFKENSALKCTSSFRASCPVEVIGCNEVGNEELLLETFQKEGGMMLDLPNGEIGIVLNTPISELPFAANLIPQRRKYSHSPDRTSSRSLRFQESNLCSYPPNQHIVHLLKLLAEGEILSLKELEEVDGYTSYLRQRNLVTDYLLQKKVSVITDLNRAPNPQPSAQKRSAAHFDASESRPPKLHRVMPEVPAPSYKNSSSDAAASELHRVSPEPTEACEQCGNRVRRRQLKGHSKVCRSLIVRWADGAYTNELRGERCSRCGVTFGCEKDLQLHMAAAHHFQWRLEFRSDEEFRHWFRDEGLDETMISGPSKTIGSVREKVFYCAINRYQNKVRVECPCRLVVKRDPTGTAVRYFPLHSHEERFVRRIMSAECRDAILRLLREGLSNAEILERLRGGDSELRGALDRFVTREAISRLRHRYCRPQRPPGQPERRGRRRAAVVSRAPKRVFLTTFVDDAEMASG